jgi:hypothetical protein
VQIAKGTIVSTLGDAPLRFETTQNGTVPEGPGKTVIVPVKAVVPGKSGNVTAGQLVAIEGTTGLMVTVTNPEPMAGGSDRVSVAPSKADYERLREMLIEDLTQTAIKELNSGLTEGQILIPASVKEKTILTETDEPEMGQPGDQLKMTLRVEFSAWTISKADVEHLAVSILDANIPEGTQAVPDTLVTEMAGDSSLPEDTAHWEVRARRMVRTTVSQERLSTALVGKPAKEAETMLFQQLNLREAPEVAIFPSFWNRLPYLPFRIHLVVK